MAILLMTVSEVFEIKGRGTVPMPGVKWDLPVILRIGQSVELRRPDKSRTSTEICGIELLNPNPHKVTPLLFKLPKSEFPPGTEIWTLD